MRFFRLLVIGLLLLACLALGTTCSGCFAKKGSGYASVPPDKDMHSLRGSGDDGVTSRCNAAEELLCGHHLR
jgi:hypothetical protein